MADRHMKVLKVGIASDDFVRARTIAMAKGRLKRRPDDPKIWFTSMASLAQILSEPNRLLLDLIRTSKPSTLTELATLSGRAKSNLSRTLKTMEDFGLVRLERSDRTLRPVVDYDSVEIEVPLATAA